MISYLTFWAALVGGIWLLFDKADQIASGETKTWLLAWLKNSGSDRAFYLWPDKFGKIFDAIFGNRHLSRKCFIRNVIASILSFLIISVLYISIHSDQMHLLWRIFQDDAIYVATFFLAIILNTIPDYVSLLETRIILNRMQKYKSHFLQICLLFLDFVLTGIIYYTFLSIGLITFNTIIIIINIYKDEPNFISLHLIIYIIIKELIIVTGDVFNYINVVNDFLFYKFVGDKSYIKWIYNNYTIVVVKQELRNTPWLLSTYFTSMWIYLFVSGSIIVRMLRYFTYFISNIERFIQLEKKPLASIGYVLVLLITIGFLLFAPIVL